MNFLSLITLAISVIWFCWWWSFTNIYIFTKQKKQSLVDTISKWTNFSVYALTIVQLFGFKIIPFTSFTAQIIGLLLVVIGIVLSVSARLSLGEEWVPGYHARKSKRLITSGVYHVVRHPIYTGILLVYIGSELVAQSYLAISFLAFFLAAYAQAKKEEQLLLSRFGTTYKTYISKTSMFLPFIF